MTNPPIAHFLSDDTRFAMVWLVVRVLLSWQVGSVLFAAAILLVLAWKTAGYYRLDRFVLP